MRVNPFMMLAAFAADWPRISALLDTGGRRTLTVQLTGLRTAPSGSAEERSAADAAVRAVLDALPADDAVRLWREGNTKRFAGTSPAVLHQGYAAADLCLLVIDGNPMVGPYLGPLRERLLAVATLSPDDIGGPMDPRLIVLSHHNGERRLPAFQFEAGAMPWRVVLAVNEELGADTDPWGAADWWLGANAWTGTAPAGLLGRDRDQELLGAARALAVPDGEE
ncbi:hypothetical protein ACWGDX_04645 [Streptomyces sp. NPDC055025]